MTQTADDFDYDLPPELIAQHPATERTASRLLRDAFGPQLMVSNDRIRANNAQLAFAYRG